MAWYDIIKLSRERKERENGNRSERWKASPTKQKTMAKPKRGKRWKEK